MTARRNAFCALLWVALALMPPRGGLAQGARGPSADPLLEGERAIAELRVEEAAAIARAALARSPTDQRVLALMGLVAFHQGEYVEAATYLERAGTAGTGGDAAALLATVVATRDLVAPMREARSADGRYRIRYSAGPDEILVPYALDTLAAADRFISEALGYRAPGPIRLELYPDAESLARVSSLTVADIARSGTIALCKWDRLMVTSPRALAHGYAWTDTISHELVHLILARATRDHAPVWVHEGIAKYLETGYRRGPEPFALDAVSASILVEAAAAQELLPFERLHPSIALLPSQRDAALAFAQVSTFVSTFHRLRGAPGLLDLVRRLAANEDARDAFAGAAGTSFNELERTWRADVRALPAPTRPRLLPRRLLAARALGGDTDADDLAEVSAEARRRLRLGDLLSGRGHPLAASHEYAAALTLAADDPVVAARFARAALGSDQATRAVAALRPVVATHPEYAPSVSLLARALEAAGHGEEARQYAHQAIRLNPFDPAPHCVLGAVGSAEERADEAARCASLGR
ncbi:MAG: hypothetical protein KC593_05920 [Myxococcales bacterium]|nr:hypothetical protein [Myxococcales bacterium]MCB9626719.1 hypothetical protein [Sandaracinaceae bacterium]